MIFYQSLFVVSLVALTSVLPPGSRPRTKRLSRGAVWADIDNLAIDEDALQAAQRLRRERRRVAVVSAGDASVDAADVAAEVIRSGLRYSDRLIIVDARTSEALFDASKGVDEIRATAKQNDVDVIVVVEIDASDKKMNLEVFADNAADPMKLEPVDLKNLADAVMDTSIQSRTRILTVLDAMPAKHREQLSRRPEASLAAIKHAIDARRQLASVIQAEDAAQRKQICQQASKAADQAIAESPNFLEAYLIKASCQDELDQSAELKQTLTMAFQKSDPPEHDQLTLLELKGDHARFVKSNLDTAYEHYEALLGTDPTNLTGLWTMIDILLTADENSDPDLEGAAEFAATLVACHPQSGVAQAIMAKQDD